MSLKINSEQQRIEGSGVVPTGSWRNATYYRQGTTVTVTSVGHGFIRKEDIQVDVTSGGGTSGIYEVTVVDADTFTFTDTASGTVTAGNTLSYKVRRSLEISTDNKLGISIGSGADTDSAIVVTKDNLGDIRVGINNTNPEFELDVEGQIRTTRSIISDTARIINLDIGTIVNPQLNLRAPNLQNYQDTDVTSPTFGTTFYPTADTPPLSDQSRRIATTDFVYQVATNDTGGRVYVSSTIGSDDNDGRSAARPVATIKKAAQIAYSLQAATPSSSDEYVSIIVSGGEYLEDNPITLPRNCSLIGDNLRRVVVRPINRDRHMIKASNETYVNGVTFRDALQNPNDPYSATLFTWKYAFVFDDKQRLYYEPELGQIPAQAGQKYRGVNTQLLTFIDNTAIAATDLQVGYAVLGATTRTEGIVTDVTYTGDPAINLYLTGTVTVRVTSGQDDLFSDTERIFYAATAGAIVETQGPTQSYNAALEDVESLRPELETISNQIYQHTVDSESETLLLNAATGVSAGNDLFTINGHGLFTGAAVSYDNDGNPNVPGLINGTVYYARVISTNTFELYDTFANANLDSASSTKQGRIDITNTGTGTHYLNFSKVSVGANAIFIERHGLTTGEQLYYRSSKSGEIGNLVDGAQYAVYARDVNWIQLADTPADATNKDAAGNDNPILRSITSTGKGFHRFDRSSKLLSIATVDTSLNTVQTYNGPIINLGATEYHDYEVGQEVNLYGFQSTAIDFGGAAVYSYSQSATTIECTISGVDTGVVGALWGNLTTLGEAGIKFNFSSGGAVSKTYHIDTFTTGTSFPSLPGNTALGMGRGAYDSATGTVRFSLKSPDSATRTGSFTALDNIEDLNGRKYITHRIERPDGFSIAFVVRGNYSVFNSALNIAGDQNVISASNYVLASLSNSPYGFASVTQTDRYRDGAEAIRANQEFIAEEAYAYIKSHHTSSSSAGNAITIGSNTYPSISTNTRSGSYSISGSTLTVTVPLGHSGYALNSYTFNWSGALPDGSYQVADTPDYRTFTINLGNSNNDGETGTVTFTTPFPHVTPGSKPQSDRYADAAALILANKTNIARMAFSSGKVLDVRLLAGDSRYTSLNGVTYVTSSGTGSGSTGGFDIGAHYRFGGTTGLRSIETTDIDFSNCQALWFVAIRGSGSNGGESPDSGENLVFEYSTNGGVNWNTLGTVGALDTTYNTLKASYFGAGALTSSTRIRVTCTVNESTGDNWGLKLIGADNTSLPVIPNGDQNCVDDVEDFLQAVAYNLTYGGNDQVYDSANYYVQGAHVSGEEAYSVKIFNIAEEIVNLVIRNQDWGVTYSTFNTYAGQPLATAQVKDATITQDIIDPACANVVSTIDTFFTILTNAIGTQGNPGNLTGVTRTYSAGDQQCLDDIIKVLRAFQYDLRYTGNSATAEAANKYISSGVIQHIANEVAFSRQVYAYAKELSILAIRNDLNVGSFSQIAPVANGSVTVDPSSPECANVVSALSTNWQILDNALSTSTAVTSITSPDPVITEVGASLYSFPLLNAFLDLPIIEASPYIQNSSLISFRGGSGCEIDGAKVATPNVPRPGLKTNAQGATVAQYDPQGKSMVASAFTIISFGGTAYNVINDGYTQLVSVFAIFCQDGIVCQSGGYASVTNSASNFGTYSLRATGYRSEPYSFDVAAVTSVENELDGNGTETGRQLITITGPNLTNIPSEDYIIKFDEFTNTNTAIEFFILETTVNSGTPGSQINATILTNASLNLTRNSDSSVFSYANNNIAGGVSSPLVGANVKLHRPSIVNSSSHTWEYSGSGNTYAALPQNGGIGRGSTFEAREQAYGQVYTSGTNEFGDFKVGNFVTIYNRTGAISFVGTVAISELTSIKITGGDITITGFSADDNLGGSFASDALLPTQAAVRDYISNNLGPYLNQPYSTNAVPSALVQLTSTGKINIDQIPALRPFNITSVASTQERLAIEDANAGDIAIETSSTTFNVAPSDVNTTTDEITITSHGLATGDQLTYTQGTSAIGGIGSGNNYYVIVVNTNTIKLAVSEANATAGTAEDLTTQGTGTQQFTTQGVAVSYILENDLDSQYLTFAPNSNYSFTVSNLVAGSSTTARGAITAYNDGAVYQYNITNAGSGYTSQTESLTISAPDDPGGTQAVATANILNGSVVSVTISNIGSGYYSAPTVSINPPATGTQAVIGALVEGRLSIDIANSIKFDSSDYILDGANFTEGTGTYSQNASTTIVITENGHGLSTNDLVYLDFTSGTAPDGFYSVSVNNVNEFQVTTTASSTASGNVNRKRIIDVLRVVNTSASDSANWTQLTSTNIDASNIVAGTIDPERLASRGVANSLTFLRGDSSYEYALQSIRPETGDAIVISGSLSDNTYIDTVTVSNGGAGYTPQSGTQLYQNLPLIGGVDGSNNPITEADDGCARATFTVSGGVITNVSVTDPGQGYAANFTVTVPPELGSPSQAATLTANKGTVNRAYGNINIDVRKANNITQNTTVWGNYGLVRFRKDDANQAVNNQGQEAGFIVDSNGGVRLDQGTGSSLTAEFIEGAQARLSAADLTNASLFTTGYLNPSVLDPNATYVINIQGSSDFTLLLTNTDSNAVSNPTPSGAAHGLQAHLRNNSATGLADGGTDHGVVTYRRKTGTSRAVTQLGFSDNNNLWIRGDSGGTSATYTNWYQIWSTNNDGRETNQDPLWAGRGVHAAGSSGPNSSYLGGQSGLWYQSGHNVGDNRGHGTIGQKFLPEVLGRDRFVLENFYVAGSGGKYELYVPNFHVITGPSGSLAQGGTYTVYSDSQAVNNIGTFVVDAAGIVEGTGNDGAIYSTITGTATFTAGNSASDVVLIGPSASGSSRWTVTSAVELSAGSAQIFAVQDNANGPFIEFGKTGVSTTPTFDFRSSGQAGDYDVRLIVSGGSGTNGQGTLRINAASLTVNGNAVWHEGNDGASSTLDARYLQGAEPATAATLNTIVKRDGSGNITGAVITGTQGVFTNNATSLSLGDANGATIGKGGTNTLVVKGKGSSTTGYLAFGNDTKFFGYNATYLWYGTSATDTTMVWRGEKVGIGNKAQNPSTLLHLYSDTGSEVELRLSAGTTANNGGADPLIRFTGQDDGTTEGFVMRYDNSVGDMYFDQVWTGLAGAAPAIRFRTNTDGTTVNAMHIQSNGLLVTSQGLSSPLPIVSTVAQGTAPFTVASTTVVTNLNADLLDGYSATNLPYLSGAVNTSINSTDGLRRFYFSNNATTYINGTNISFQTGNNTKATMNTSGRWTLDGAAGNQNTYRMEITGSSGLNINASEALSSGQKTTVLRATGDKQWIDTYGIFKRNRQTVAENVTVANGDNCMSAGPITIQSGTTVTINSGGYWSIV